jgi:hypothetical protein
VGRQVQEALVEARLAAGRMVKHCSFLVIHQDFRGHPAQVFEAADQALIGVLGVLPLGAPEVKAPGVSQLVDQEVHLGGLTGDPGLDLAPVALQLLARSSLKAHRGSPWPERSLGSDVLPKDGFATQVAFGLDLAQDHHPIPDPLPQQPVDGGLEWVQLAAAAPTQAPRRAAAFQGPTHGLGVDTQFQGDILLVDAAPVK